MSNNFSVIFFSTILFSLFSCGKDQKTKDADINNKKPVALIQGIVAKAQTIEDNIETTGNILANEEVEVKSEISGKVTKIHFQEGNSVQKGQILVSIFDEDLKAQMEKIKIEIALQQEKVKRQKQLFNSSAVSKEELEIAESNLQLLNVNAEILKTQLDKTKIRAPFSGTIGLRNISEGAIITPSTIITSVQNISPLKLDFTIPEKYNNEIKVGTKVNFKVTGVDKEMVATVYAKDPKIDPTTRTIQIRATFNNTNKVIFPGAFANVKILISKKENVIMIPTIAYIPDISGAKVFLVKGGKSTPVTVKAGLRTEKDIEIVEGISIGDTVMTSGILTSKPGTPVQISISNNTN